MDSWGVPYERILTFPGWISEVFRSSWMEEARLVLLSLVQLERRQCNFYVFFWKRSSLCRNRSNAVHELSQHRAPPRES